jgi:hypothetical protein
VGVNLTRNLDHYLDPLVKGIKIKIIFGGVHIIVVATVEIHQPLAVLERLDPLGKPRQREIIPRQPGAHQL